MKALVTGASSGIGKEIARELSKDNYDIIAVARDPTRLEALAAELRTDVTVIRANLSDRQECFRVYQQVKNEPIDIVVNNAGFGVFGPFTETDLGRELDMLDVNIDALHIFTKLFVKDFVSRNYGYILNIASSAAFMPGPLFCSYYASKAYVLRLTQAIHDELRRTSPGVYIGALCPGPVATNFNQNAGVSFSLHSLSAKEVAEYAVKKMYDRKTVIVPGVTMKIVRFFSKLLPDSVMARLAWINQRKKMGG